MSMAVVRAVCLSNKMDGCYWLGPILRAVWESLMDLSWLLRELIWGTLMCGMIIFCVYNMERVST